MVLFIAALQVIKTVLINPQPHHVMQDKHDTVSELPYLCLLNLVDR